MGYANLIRGRIELAPACIMEYKYFKSEKEAKKDIDYYINEGGREYAVKIYQNMLKYVKDPIAIQCIKESLYTISVFYPYKIPKRKITWVEK